MTVESHIAGNARVIRAQVLRDQAKRLREEAGMACEHSGEIREVLLLNDPLKRRRNSAYRDCACLIDVLDRILDRGIMVEPWRRVTLTGIDLSKGRLTTALIQTYLLNEEIIVNRRKRLRLSSCAGLKLSIPQPANFFDRLDRIFDKGIVVDSWQHIRVSGIDMLGVEVRSVVASIQTHLLYESPHISRKARKMQAAPSSM
jgi:hypothetical protein